MRFALNRACVCVCVMWRDFALNRACACVCVCDVETFCIYFLNIILIHCPFLITCSDHISCKYKERCNFDFSTEM